MCDYFISFYYKYYYPHQSLYGLKNPKSTLPINIFLESLSNYTLYSNDFNTTKLNLIKEHPSQKIYYNFKVILTDFSFN